MTRNPEKFKLELRADYRSLLDEQSWARLHPDIQMRFSPQYAHRSVTYRGIMNEIYLSFPGKLLAQACRLIGTPLALYTGTDIPVDVNVYPDENLQGMTWDRYYFYPGRQVNRIKSTKCIQNEQHLIEVTGSGFGMYLSVYEKHSAICFESTKYFFQIGNWKLPIPSLLTPGKTIVKQSALEDSCFEFSFDVEHPLLGRVFRQVGVFSELN